MAGKSRNPPKKALLVVQNMGPSSKISLFGPHKAPISFRKMLVEVCTKKKNQKKHDFIGFFSEKQTYLGS